MLLDINQLFETLLHKPHSFMVSSQAFGAQVQYVGFRDVDEVRGHGENAHETVSVLFQD